MLTAYFERWIETPNNVGSSQMPYVIFQNEFIKSRKKCHPHELICLLPLSVLVVVIIKQKFINLRLRAAFAIIPDIFTEAYRKIECKRQYSIMYILCAYVWIHSGVDTGRKKVNKNVFHLKIWCIRYLTRCCSFLAGLSVFFYSRVKHICK